MADHYEQSYYEILEVDPEAPQHVIHEAYQRAKQTYSSDSPALYSMFTPEEAKELLKVIEEAFSVLGNQSLRSTYDEKLRLKKDWEAPLPESTEAFSIDQAPLSENSWGEGQPSIEQNTSQPEGPSWDNNKGNENFTPPPTNPQFDGKTSLSTYLIDDSFEAEIREQTHFNGPLLQRIREYKNIPLGQMSDSTRISRSYLESIETNDFENLPAPVFVRGFVIQIAKILDLNEQVVAASYMKLFKENLKK